jgi:hypothetical protein
VVSFTPRPLYPRERALGTHLIGGWAASRAGLDDVEKRKFLTLPGLELRPLGRRTRSQSLYRLRYPCSFLLCIPVDLLQYTVMQKFYLLDIKKDCGFFSFEREIDVQFSLHYPKFPGTVTKTSSIKTRVLRKQHLPVTSACIVTGYGPGFDSRQGQEILLYSTTYRMVLVPIQPPIHWVAGAFPRG